LTRSSLCALCRTGVWW